VANGSSRRVTSGQRAVAAEILMNQGRLSLAEAAVWADALALLVEDGQDDAPQVLLSRVVNQLTAGRACRALLGRLGVEEDRLAAAVEEVFRTAVELPPGDLPSWAETGIIDTSGHRVFGKHTLDLDAAELADGMPWPPVTVMTFQVAGAPAGVLLEVGPGGLPHRIFSSQARRIGTALLDAAELADQVNS
jgi:hypothetical protein